MVAAASGGEHRPKRRRSGVRGPTSLALLVLASLALLAGGVTLYVREEILNSSAFADRAVNAVQQPVLRHVVAREIVVQVLEPALPDLIAARPVVESAVDIAVGSKPFGHVVHLAAEHGHRLLFQQHGGNVVFDIADAGTVVASALHTLAPKIAGDLPKRVESILLTLRRRSFAGTTLRLAEKIRLLGIVLPPVAVVLLALGIVVAPDRRRAVTRAGVAVGVTGIAFAIVFEVFRRYVVAHVYGANELTTAEVRGAVGELWGVYLGDLLIWTLVVSGVAWLVAAASSSVLRPYSGTAGVRRLRDLAHRPLSTPFRVARGALALAVGLFAILKPTLALQIGAVIGGALVVYFGLGELLSATAPAQPPARRPRPGRRHAVAFGGAGATLAAAIIVAVVVTGAASRARASGVRTCNGYAQLCSRRLDEVVFAGTHNAMSAADSPGWLIANQDRTIAQQLDNGIRLFKISTHYGVETSDGRVYTDISAEGNRVNRVAKKLDPRARRALQRFSRSLGGGSPAGKRDIWLCHTLCELGATRMVTFLGTIRRFLELNPDQVIILFDEDYVAERDLQSAFKRAGLFRYLATLHAGQPLPTLGALIASHHNVVVFAQNPPSGKYAWDANAFSWIQDTPLGAKKPDQFTCKLNRGRASNPLLMMNDWADIFPPRPSPNIPLVQRSFILKRARQCERQRGQIPNLILTDYYDRGDVTGAVAKLNGVAGQRSAPVEPVSMG